MLEMLLFFSALLIILFIALYFLDVEPYRKKGFIQRIGELLLFSYRKVCEIVGYGIHYLKIKGKYDLYNHEPGIDTHAQNSYRLHPAGNHRHVDSSESMYCKKYDYNLKILK